MRSHLIVGLLAALAAPAAASPANANGFFTSGIGELRGKVTDSDGKPLAKAEVHVVAASGSERVLVTDDAGAFRVELRGGGTASVFVLGGGHVTGQLAVPAAGDDGEEVIEIHEVLPPATPPKARGNSERIPEYTDLAMDKDVWTRAWLMLDVSAQGKVTRVAMLDSPGFGLDAIAVREALKLEFEPARDRSNRPVNALTVYTFEWPAYWWMMEKRAPIYRMPMEALGVPCRTAKQPKPHLRDCRTPTVAKAASARWIEAPAKPR